MRFLHGAKRTVTNLIKAIEDAFFCVPKERDCRLESLARSSHSASHSNHAHSMPSSTRTAAAVTATAAIATLVLAPPPDVSAALSVFDMRNLDNSIAALGLRMCVFFAFLLLIQRAEKMT